ncbi:MAG: hypothetical protein Q4C00_00160, partial [Bacillota bacterium]|nr:hypothetical protein [Bacillota bacterium]
WWPLIVLSVILFILFYPVVIRMDLRYTRGEWGGKITLHWFFGAKWPKVSLWDSEASPEDKEKKAEKKREKKEKKKKKNKEDSNPEGKFTIKNWDQLPLKELFLSVADIFKTLGQRIKLLRVRLVLGYALEDPAAMGYITGVIYSALGIVSGDQHRSRWRVGIYPDWQYFAAMAYCKAKATLCIFDIFYAFGGILIKAVKTLLQTLRRK